MYVGEYKPKTSLIKFKTTKDVLVAAETPILETRRFKRRINVIAFKSHMEDEDTPANKKIFVYGFKHIKTDELDNFILIGCASNEIYENIKLLNFWCNKFIYKERTERFQDNGLAFYKLS